MDEPEGGKDAAQVLRWKDFVQHPLEAKFNAPGWDILSAIEKGFRAQVDVKGKLAEYFLYQELLKLKQKGVIDELEWRDQDGVPDFLIGHRGRSLQMECKNVRGGRETYRDSYKVELQKTRNKIGGGPSRGYRADEFDLLAACTFNQSGKWEYLFIATTNLTMRPDWPDYLMIFQKVPHAAEGNWKATLEDVLSAMLES